MKKLGIYVICACAITLSSLSCDQNYLSVVDSNIETGAIDLSDLSQDIDLPTSAREIKIGRGEYTYTLQKKKTLKFKEYMVTNTDMLSFTSAHKAAPEDAYSRTLEVVDGNDSRAVHAINTFQSGRIEIKTSEDKRKADQMIEDVNHMNRVKFPIAILPSDSFIRKRSKKIQEKDTIYLTGVQYEITKIVKNGVTQPKTRCLSMDIIYVVDLDIKK